MPAGIDPRPRAEGFERSPWRADQAGSGRIGRRPPGQPGSPAHWQRRPLARTLLGALELAVLTVAGLVLGPPARAEVARGRLLADPAATSSTAPWHWPGQPTTGFALRQTTLVAGWPEHPAGSGLPPGAMGIADTRLRSWLNDRWYGVRFSGAVEFETGYGSAPSSNLGLLGDSNPGVSRPFDVLDLTWVPTSPTSATSRAEVERADLRWSTGPLDFDVGRQPISLGTSHFVSVLDVLAPFAPGSLDASYKPGIDAVRVSAGFGEQGVAELIVAGTDPWNRGGTLARLHDTLAGMDVEILGGRFRDRSFGGFDWDGQVGPAGLWGEFAAFQRLPGIEQYRGGLRQVALSGVAGADLSLPFDLQGSFGLLYQDFGARRPEDLPSVYTDAPYRQGWDFLGSAGYGVVTLSRALGPLVSGSVSGLVNLVDGSTLWEPQVTYSVSDNADLGAYVWAGVGAPPARDGATVVPRSEFGMVPTGGGLYARWFF